MFHLWVVDYLTKQLSTIIVDTRIDANTIVVKTFGLEYGYEINHAPHDATAITYFSRHGHVIGWLIRSENT